MNDFAIDRPFTLVTAGVICLVVSTAGARIASSSGALHDEPNHRSSHAAPVSRAGGISMGAALLAGLLILAVFGGGRGLAGPAAKFALVSAMAGGVGLIDDWRNLKPPVKFVGQLVVAFAFIWLIGPLASAPLPFIGETSLGFFGAVITLFWIIAFMNVFNFMDGVNGIAAGCAAVGLFFFAGIAAIAAAGAASVIALIGVLAALGFLPANVLRGRLFMGDSGSHLLAFLIAGLGVFAANVSGAQASALIMPVIFLPFIFDVAFTLAHRFIRRQNILVAHREHLYQLILQRGASHATVAMLYAAATAFCAGAAGLMLTLAPQQQWMVPVVLIAGFTAIALRLYRESVEDGLIAPADETASSSPRPF